MDIRKSSALKFKFFLDDNNLTAKDIANILHISPKTVYAYRSGTIQMPDDYKKILEQEIGLNIYDVFYNPYFDKVANTTVIEKEIVNG